MTTTPFPKRKYLLPILVLLLGCQILDQCKGCDKTLPPDSTDDTPHKAGIPNRGMTCYMNSALQVIAAFPVWKDEILTCIQQADLQAALRVVLEKVSKGEENVTTQEIDNLINQLKDSQVWKHKGDQEDSSEFLDKLLDPDKVGYQTKPISDFSKLFLNCIVKDAQHKVSMEERICESLDYELEERMKKSRICKSLDLEYDQPVAHLLPVHLPNNHDGIRITPYTTDSFSCTIPAKYMKEGRPLQLNLQAFIVHEGAGVNRGHYKAYIKKGGQWYCTNDSIVTPIDNQAAEQQAKQAYLFFYQKELKS